MKRLGLIVNSPDLRLASISVERSEYLKFTSYSPIAAIYGPAFSVCAQLVFSLVERVLHVSGFQPFEKIGYVFEKGDREHEMHASMSEYERVNPELRDSRSVAFLPKREPLVQVADLIAGVIQEVLMRAHASLGFLDNGLMMTPLEKFERYYTLDGKSAALLKSDRGHPLCFVVNRKLLEDADASLRRIVAENPKVLLRRMPQSKSSPA